MSVEWWYWWRTCPLALIPVGQWMTIGSQVPPENCEYRLNIWNGVLKATAQPVG